MDNKDFNNLENEQGTTHAVITGFVSAIVVIGLAFGLLYFDAWLASLLWNGVLVSMFSSIKEVTIWQMLGLQFLAGLMFPGRWLSILTSKKEK